MLQFILASQSPRRRDLLNKEGFVFEIHTVNISEFLDKNLSLDDALLAIARSKAQALVESGKLSESQEYLLLSADTVVILDGRVIGKPKNREEAKEHLRRLSGQTHEVKTAVCLWHLPSGKQDLAVKTSQVKFREIAESEMEAYVATEEPMDKAGAYAVQGDGGKFIEKIEGSVENVIGLPVDMVKEMLQRNGWKVARKDS
jgi:septum formation protein